MLALGRRYFINYLQGLLLLSLLVLACMTVFANTYEYHISTISNVKAMGNMNLFIRYGKKPILKVVQQGHSAPDIFARVIKNKLILCTSKTCLTKHPFCLACSGTKSHTPDVYLSIPELSQLSFLGKGKVTAKHIRSYGLHVMLHNCGTTWISGKQLPLQELVNSGCGPVTITHVLTPRLKVKLAGSSVVNIRGISNLQKLSYSGKGALNMYWLNSCHLDIKGSNQGKAFIAGVAQDTHIQLSNHAYLDARYLRTKKEVVATVNYSRADVFPNQILNAYAQNNSNIYYYHDPLALNKYMRGNGSVLRMVNLHTHCTPDMPLYSLATCPLTSVYRLG